MLRKAETLTGRKLKAIRTDNAEEYLAIDSFLDERDAIHEWTPPYSHESNELSERFNRTIMTMARSMFAGTSLPRSLWAEAINTAVYTKNRLPHQGLERGTTPYEALHGTKPSIEHLQPFGRKCFAHILPKQRKAGSKLMPRAKQGHFVGYNLATHKIYRIYISSENKLVETRHVKFAPFVQSGTIETHELLPKTVDKNQTGSDFCSPKQKEQPITSATLPLSSWTRVQRLNQEIQEHESEDAS